MPTEWTRSLNQYGKVVYSRSIGPFTLDAVETVYNAQYFGRLTVELEGQKPQYIWWDHNPQDLAVIQAALEDAVEQMLWPVLVAEDFPSSGSAKVCPN